MKQLPEINKPALTIVHGLKKIVYIVAHYDDKAVYVYEMDGGVIRCDMAVAANFEPVPVYTCKVSKPDLTTIGCPSGEHNYVQVHEAHSNKAFCTRCGSTINLE